MRPLGLVALLACAGLGLQPGCGLRSPEGVADKFVDYYFVEIDQGRALPLTAGLAHDMIERELRDVASIRKQMGYMPADARPDVYYKRTGARDEGERTVFTYDITIKHREDVMRKVAQVAVHKQGAEWKVIFYKVADGEAPQRPPG
ncbi:MAG TPA: hypothetical protein VKN99_26175 [Polyangia bacterium]|nr:hypothetical protein [Polyangia bacterium]